MSWLDKISGSQLLTKGVRKRNVPEGLWTKCDSCQSVLYRAELERTLEVCPKCGAHHPITARARRMRWSIRLQPSALGLWKKNRISTSTIPWIPGPKWT